MALARLDGLALQTIVRQQGLVTLLEGLGSFDAGLDGGGQAIGPMKLRYAAQLPQGVLQALTEALQALGETDGAGLPVGVGQDEVVNHVIEREAIDGHAQFGAVGEVAGTQACGIMDLGEEDLLGGALQRAPLPTVALEGSQLAIGEAARKAPLQVGKEGLGFQSRVALKQFLDLGPDLGERIGSSSPVAVHAFDLAGKPAKPAILAQEIQANSVLNG